MFKVIETILTQAVAAGGSFTVGYPPGTTKGMFQFGVAHRLRAGNTSLEAPRDFSVTLGNSSVTVTLGTDQSTIPSGTKVLLQLDDGGDADTDRVDSLRNISARGNAALGEVVFIELGTPATADADGVCATQDVDANESAILDGALVSGGEAVFDVPRNVVAAWTGTAVCTVTGKDEYDETIVESSGSGTSMTGKKAFKKVTDVSFSAAVTSATVGTGDVFGLPLFLPSSACVLAELEDGAVASAGTIVAGVTSAATATTGDVRGTYDPASAADGAKSFTLIVALKNPEWKGVAQYGG